MKGKPAPSENTVLLDRVVGGLPSAERRTMFGYACYVARGHLAIGLFGDGMMMRLSEKDRFAFLRLPGAAPFSPMPGRTMKGYVSVPSVMLKDERALRTWASKALAYSAGLPPKKKKR